MINDTTANKVHGFSLQKGLIVVRQILVGREMIYRFCHVGWFVHIPSYEVLTTLITIGYQLVWLSES